MKYLNKVLTVDPGYNTGLALWRGDLFPVTSILKTTKDKTYDKIKDLSNLFDKFLIIYDKNIDTVIIEGVNLWGGSFKSQASTMKGYTFNLAYLIGAYITRVQDLCINLKIVYVSNTTVDKIKYVGWKQQLSSKALKERIKRINGVEKYPEHIQEAVGIGLNEMDLL